jgi:Tol biopolymer transport system component
MKTTVLLISFLTTSTAFAQFWRALPVTNPSVTPYAFAHDDKRVLTFEADGRITAFDLKTSAATELAQPSERKLLIQLIARPYLLYSKNVDGDHHIFRLKNDGLAPEEDITPLDGTLNSILGQSYTGRYIYYASFQKSRNKTDFYRYDAQQNISELVLANDKDYKVHAWSRDQKRLLVENPQTKELTIVDITSTDRFPLYTPMGENTIVQAGWTADNKSILVLEHSAKGTELRAIAMTSPTSIGEDIKVLKEGDIASFDLSSSGKYLYLTSASNVETLYDLATMTPIAFPEGAKGIVFNARESLALYHTAGGEKKLFLYDIAKQSARELVAKQ